MSSPDPAAPAAESSTEPKPAASGGKQFIVNVLWNWLGVISTIGAAVLLQPYIIRKLGNERYGMWALVFSTLDYVRLFDLGLRAAVVNFSARCRTRNDHDSLNQVLSTAALYYGALATVIIVFSVALSGLFPSVFNVSEHYRDDAVKLVAIVGISVAIGMFSSMFTGLLEAFQRFDLVNHAYTMALFVRMTGSVVLLYLGFGLVELGLLALMCQIGERIWNVLSVRRVFPQLRLRPFRASFGTLRELTGYSFSSFLVGSGFLVSNQTPLVLIGYFTSPATVAFFSLPYRLVMYIGDLVARVGSVTVSKVAELDEHGDAGRIRILTVVINRYCYTLFVPLATFLLIYGRELLALLVTPSFAAQAAEVLPLVTVLTTLTIAGMFNTVATLIGKGKHRGFAWGVALEVITYIAALSWSIPRFGVAGAAWTALGVLTVSRGLMPAWIFCRQNHQPLWKFLASIYVMPTMTALPAAAAAWFIKQNSLSGETWLELVAAGVLIAAIYYSLALFTCLEHEHRRLIRRQAERYIRPGTV